ncbi:MAG: hypothetical protein ACLP9C_07800 [Acidimicrobiales bacterium]
MRIRSVLVAAVLGGCAVAALPTVAGAVAPPEMTVTPSGPYHNGETINISVGPNRFFKPYGRVNVIECADPGGTSANLPRDETSCDGNTIQGNTILVKGNGSFSERRYELFSLPSTVLGEVPDSRPVCNRKNMCVLYVGEDQGNFTWPKEFSRPFAIRTGGSKR